MHHLFLSPHPDDAAFSCGGRIVQLRGAGDSVLIYTVTSGTPPPNYAPNAYVVEHFERWGIGMDVATVVSNRRDEDAAAAHVLGAAIAFGPHPDAIYRNHPATNEPLYPKVGDVLGIFGAVQPDDPLTAEQISETILKQVDSPPRMLYAPLGIGNHVDHQLTRAAALHLAAVWPACKVYFYEDYPYAREGRRVTMLALNAFGQPLLRVNHTLDEKTLALKIQASACYRSQRSSFWASDEALAADMRAYDAAVGGENFWRLINSDDPLKSSPGL